MGLQDGEEIMTLAFFFLTQYTSCSVLGRVFRVGGLNGAISGYTKSKLAAGRHLGKFRVAISPQRLIRSIFAIAQLSCLVRLRFGSGSLGEY